MQTLSVVSPQHFAISRLLSPVHATNAIYAICAVYAVYDVCAGDTRKVFSADSPHWFAIARLHATNAIYAVYALYPVYAVYGVYVVYAV